MVLPWTNPRFSILDMVVMSLLFQLLSIQGCGWLLLSIRDRPIGSTAENCVLTLLTATQLLRWLKELLDCSVHSSGIYSGMSLSMLPWLLWGCAITGSVPVEWILQQIMVHIFCIYLAWTFGDDNSSSTLTQQYLSVHASLSAWLMFLVSHLHCAKPPGPTYGRTIKWLACQADRQWWIAVALCAINVGLFFSINDRLFIHTCHMQ